MVTIGVWFIFYLTIAAKTFCPSGPPSLPILNSVGNKIYYETVCNFLPVICVDYNVI